MKVICACFLVISGYALCWFSTPQPHTRTTTKNIVVDSMHRNGMQQVLERIEQGRSLNFSEGFSPKYLVAILTQKISQVNQRSTEPNELVDQFNRFPDFEIITQSPGNQRNGTFSELSVIANFGDAQVICTKYEIVVRSKRFLVLFRE